MKKTITIMIGFFAIMCFSSSVYAVDVTWNNVTGGATLTVGDTTATQITYEASPGVLITGGNDETTYCILAGNTKGGDNTIGYCVSSNSGKMGQKKITWSDTPVIADLGTPTTTGLLLTGFATK